MLANPRDIPDRLAALQDRVDKACRASNRSSEDIVFVAVTKFVPADLIKAAMGAGLSDLGESRVQEALKKRGNFPEFRPRWHMIGHLQTNKAKKAVDAFDLIQSVDSFRLAEILNREGEKLGRPVRALAEVKISPEPAKTGILPAELDDFLDSIRGFPYFRLEGLMAVAPYFDDPQMARPYFRRMKKTFDDRRKYFAVDRPRLSMGMSGDFEAALEEGSNMIRIGTALFGGR